MKKNLKYLQIKKDKNEKITMLACHDAPTAKWAEKAGVDIILVGDSLGVNFLGYNRSEQVTTDDILHHFRAVHRVTKNAYLIVDLPLSSCKNTQHALDDANKLIDYGADAVRIRTFDLRLAKYLLTNYIDICFDVVYPLVKQQFGPSAEDTTNALIEIIKIALELQKDGVAMFLFTLFPEQAAKAATELLTVPTLGVGSGPFTNGQMLIAAEMLGICNISGNGRYNKQYVNMEQLGLTAIQKFVQETQAGGFPMSNNSVSMESSDAISFLNALEKAIFVSEE
ncbi:MAG: 3-methyl-2-oxobutanoate hydroxymethyltransferase [Desulfobacteraceae bacterium]|jgi:3-methyl-2-oxobutanoate hydroxymethyltransferase